MLTAIKCFPSISFPLRRQQSSPTGSGWWRRVITDCRRRPGNSARHCVEALQRGNWGTSSFPTVSAWGGRALKDITPSDIKSSSSSLSITSGPSYSLKLLGRALPSVSSVCVGSFKQISVSHQEVSRKSWYWVMSTIKIHHFSRMKLNCQNVRHSSTPSFYNEFHGKAISKEKLNQICDILLLFKET